MRDRDDYRSLSDAALLLTAREQGIDPEMAIVLAERLEEHDRMIHRFGSLPTHTGGRYAFNHRSN